MLNIHSHIPFCQNYRPASPGKTIGFEAFALIGSGPAAPDSRSSLQWVRVPYGRQANLTARMAFKSDTLNASAINMVD